MNKSASWYGRYAIPMGGAGTWNIGPLTMVAKRRAQEWRIERHRGPDPYADTLHVDVPCDPGATHPDAEVNRYAVGATDEPFTVSPVLASRAVIANPEVPFLLPPKERVTAYVTTPIWLEIGDGPSRTLGELAVQQVQDTWFGPDTVTGTLCFASRTQLRLDPDELIPRPWRAITPVVLQNTADTTLTVERVRLPVPNLPLYQAADGRLWTAEVTLDHQSANLARVRAVDRPPPQAPAATLLAPARERLDSNILVHAFGALLRL